MRCKALRHPLLAYALLALVTGEIGMKKTHRGQVLSRFIMDKEE